MYAFCLQMQLVTQWCIHSLLKRNALYAWADNKRIDVCLFDRKYLCWCTLFWPVSLCIWTLTPICLNYYRSGVYNISDSKLTWLNCNSPDYICTILQCHANKLITWGEGRNNAPDYSIIWNKSLYITLFSNII